MLDGQPLESQPVRSYFVRPRTAAAEFQGFVMWDGPAWPPSPPTAQSLAMALADTLGVNLVETFLAFITSDATQRQQLLDIAGAWGHYQDVLDELAEEPSVDTDPDTQPAEPTAAPESAHPRSEGHTTGPDPAAQPAPPPVPLHSFSSLLLDGEPLIITGDRPEATAVTGDRSRGRQEPDPGVASGARVRAPAGTDLSALDTLGMQIAVAYETRRLGRDGDSVAIIANGTMLGEGHNLIVEVHSPAAIRKAQEFSAAVENAMNDLEAKGVSRVHPGFDLLAICDGEIERLIELKSSGVDARVQAMSWNEWKSASHSDLRRNFWLYLAGNLRADLGHASPYLRAIHDPFGS